MSNIMVSEDKARIQQLQDDSKRMGVTLTHEQASGLLRFVEQLQRWNRTYNLTAIREPEQMISHHLLDSLAALPSLTEWRIKADSSPMAVEGSPRILDVGSGGGLPGIVIALVQPTWSVTCVDAVEKKTSFVRQMAGVLGLPKLMAEHARVERLSVPPYDIVISRAFASLSDFVALAGQHVAESGILMAMKGRYPDDEITDLAANHPDWILRQTTSLKVPGLSAERCLLVLQRVAAPPS